MELKVLSPQWGHEALDLEDFFIKAKDAGYDGIETWMPEHPDERTRFKRLLREYDLLLVSHQHQASGENFAAFCKSFEYYLHLSLECNPILINSHSGRDYFSLAEQLSIIDIAENFSVKNNICVAHETHRGRIGYGPGNAGELFNLRPAMKITADLSHWVCVTESYLENFSAVLATAVERTEHVHARVGFTEGPQVPDPRSPHWQKELNFFMDIWQRLFDHAKSTGKEQLSFTTEFGPPPYMWTSPETNLPVASQWDINVFMKDLLRKQLQ